MDHSQEAVRTRAGTKRVATTTQTAGPESQEYANKTRWDAAFDRNWASTNAPRECQPRGFHAQRDNSDKTATRKGALFFGGEGDKNEGTISAIKLKLQRNTTPTWGHSRTSQQGGAVPHPFDTRWCFALAPQETRRRRLRNTQPTFWSNVVPT